MGATLNRIGIPFAIMAISLQCGLMFAYAFGSKMLNYDDLGSNFTMRVEYLIPLIFTLIFILAGFGSLLSYLKNQTLSGIAIALLTLSVNIHLGLMMQKFWYNTFIYDFGGDATSTAVTPNFDYTFRAHNERQLIRVNFITIQIALMCSISTLVAFTGFIGKIRLIQVFLTTVIFNVGWNLAYYCNVRVNFKLSTFNSIFDDFGIYSIYTYGAFFGLVMSIFLRMRSGSQNSQNQNRMSRGSAVQALLGTAFIFLAFLMTTNPYPFLENLTGGQLLANQSRMNIIFSLSASVIGTYIFSAIFRCGKVGVMEAIYGTISGGIIIAGTSTFISNIAAAIAIGLFAGLICAAWYRVGYPLLNQKIQMDSMGLFGSVFLISIIGGVIITPTIVKVLANLEINPSNVFGRAINNNQDIGIASLQLAYGGIAAGTGIVAGVICALITCCLRSNQDDYTDVKLFEANDFGLNDKELRDKNQHEQIKPHSAQDLNRHQ